MQKIVVVSDSKNIKRTVKKQFDKKSEGKKIGFLGGVAFIISAVIGVGIFLKNGQILSFSLGNFTLALLAWIVTSMAVIALGLSLIVIGAKTRNDLGILQWAKDFCTPYMFQIIKAYFIFLYIPLIVCGDTFYFLQSLQQAFPSWKLSWYIPWIVALCVLIYFSIANTLSKKLVVFHAKFSFYLKLFPLFFFGFVAFIMYGINYDGVQDAAKSLMSLNASGFIKQDPNNLTNFYYSDPMLVFGPEIGFFASIPPMFFAFDGFYYVISIQDQLKDKKKTPWIMMIGILCVVVIFLLITISLILSTNYEKQNAGSIMGVNYLHKNYAWKVVNSVLNICICIGCIGIVSSSINFASGLYKELGYLYELPFFERLIRKYHLKRHNLALIYLFTYLGLFILLICVIGTFGFMNLDNYNFGHTKGAKIDQLYSFINTVTNWESLFTFASFTFIILGSWRALRKKKLIITNRRKKALFMFESIFAFIVIGFAVIFAIIQATGNLALVCENSYFFDKNASFYDLNNLNGTQVEYNNHIYTLVENGNKITWQNATTLVGNDISKFDYGSSQLEIINNSANVNPSLLALIWNNNINNGLAGIQTLINSLNSSTNIAVYQGYVLNGYQSLYGQLNQFFVARVINFCILVAIISVCLLYATINIHWAKRKSWFHYPDNIFTNTQYQIQM